jgi:hypothetical protein
MSTNLHAAQLEEILSLALCVPMDNPHDKACRWGAPIVFWGPPGIGKSGRVETAGACVDLPVETLYLSTHQPEDLSGVPMDDGKGGARNVCTLPQVLNLRDAGRGILFLDEISTARPAVQAAGLGVVYTRKVAGQAMPGGVRIVAAANEAEDAAGGWNLAPPMANRFLHLKIGAPAAEEWAVWLLGGSQDVEPIAQSEATVREKWNDCWSRTRGLAVGFIRAASSNLYLMPPVGRPERGKAWASPRSWEVGLRCLATADALGKSELGIRMLQASVGEGPVVEWIEWVKKADLPDPKTALDGGWTPNRARLDIAFAVLGSCISWSLGKEDMNDRCKYVALSWKLLQKAIDNKLADVALYPAASLMRAGYSTKCAYPEVVAAARSVVLHFGNAGLSKYVRV